MVDDDRKIKFTWEVQILDLPVYYLAKNIMTYYDI